MPPETAPRVSIIMRTKDRPLLLERALDDVLGQTFPDWELVLVNDGGQPAAIDELIAARDARFAGRLVRIDHEEARGMEAASNAGLAVARGEFVAVHDDDDTWHELFLEATTTDLQRDPVPVAVAVRTEIIIERVDGGTIHEIERRPFGPPHDVVTLLDLLLINRIVPIGLLTRTTVARELGGFDESLPVVGDWEFNLRLARRGSIDFLPERPLAFWHQRPETSGILANSLFDASNAHARHDRLVRDKILRTELEQSGGTGQLLYLAMLVDEIVRGAEGRIIQEQRRSVAESEERIVSTLGRVIQTYSPVASARRVVRRMFGRDRRR